MNNSKILSDHLAHEMQKVEDATVKSFEETFLPTARQLNKALDFFDIGKTEKISNLKSRRLFIVSDGDADITVSSKEMKETPDIKMSIEEVFYISCVQTRYQIYLLVTTPLNFYDLINREPYRQSLGEYVFQKSLATSIGVENAVAYRNITSCDVVHINNLDNLDFQFYADDLFSYILFCL